jgi:hypothetical protein
MTIFADRNLAAPRGRLHGPMDRLSYGAAVSGSTDEARWKLFAFEWFGLTPLRGRAWRERAWCAHYVAGVRCTDECNIQEHVDMVLWDHARAWRDRSGRVVVTLEPWGNPFGPEHFGQFQRLMDYVAPYGIGVGFEGLSPYGSSYTIFLRKADESDSHGKWLESIPAL